MRVAVISDTHSLLRPELLALVKGADHILHAGDVGVARILEELSALAPVLAVRGNIDTHGPCAELPMTEAIELGGQLFYLVHRIEDLDLNPAAAGISVVISGHSHRSSVLWKEGVLYLNPGSVGPRRFNLPTTMAFVSVNETEILPEIVTIV